jgi:hypothetical protein
MTDFKIIAKMEIEPEPKIQIKMALFMLSSKQNHVFGFTYPNHSKEWKRKISTPLPSARVRKCVPENQKYQNINIFMIGLLL